MYGRRLHVTFVDKEAQEHTFEVAKGDNLLDIAQANDLEMEGTAWGEAVPLCRTADPVYRCLWRVVRVFDLSCHRRRPGHVRQGARTGRRGK